MADDGSKSNIISDLVGLYTSLRNRAEPKGVDGSRGGSVVRDDAGRIKPDFLPGEEAKLTKIFKLLGNTLEIGKFAKGPEAKRLEDLTSQKGSVGAVKDKIAGVVKPTPDGKGDFIKTLLGALGAAALGVFSWSLLPKELKEKIKSVLGGLMDSVMTTFKNLDMKTLLKIGLVIGGIVLTIGLLASSFNKISVSMLKFALGVGAITLAMMLLVEKGIKPFEAIGWETLGKAGATITAIGVAGLLIGNNLVTITKGALALGLISAAVWAISEAIVPFTKIDWEVLGIAATAIVGLGVISAVAGTGPVPGVIALGALALGALGVALIPFAYAANLAAPAIDKIADSFVKLKDIPVGILLAVGPALAAIGAGLAAFSVGGALSSIIDGITSLFGAESPFNKIIELGKAAPGVTHMVNALKQLNDIRTDQSVRAIDNVNAALYNLLGTYAKVERSGIKINTINDLIKNTSNTSENENIKILSSNTVEHNKFAKSALIEQIKRQDTMIELLMQLVRKPVGNSTVINKQQSSVGGSDFRVGFNDQTLAY